MRIWDLVDHPEWLEEAARWFARRWDVPEEAYRESMEASCGVRNVVPQWYVMREGDEPTGAIVAGCGIIENDFHDCPDLAPNLCALYVDERHRGAGLARQLLAHGRRAAGNMGYRRLYLVTDHEGFYERCGWEHLGFARDVEGLIMRLYGIDTVR